MAFMSAKIEPLVTGKKIANGEPGARKECARVRNGALRRKFCVCCRLPPGASG